MRCIINTGFIKIHSAVSLIVSVTWKHKQVIFLLITALDYLIKYFFFPPLRSTFYICVEG